MPTEQLNGKELAARLAWMKAHNGVFHCTPSSTVRHARADITAIPTALKGHKLTQARMRRKAAELWRENDLVFCSEVGTELDHHNVRRAFANLTKAAGVGGDWTPRELRHSFVSILSDDGTSIEIISHLMGHNGTAVTEGVYRHDVAVLSEHVEPVNRLLGEAP